MSEATDPLEPEELTVEGGSSRPARSRGRDARLVLTGICAVLLVWFALANLHEVTIRFWLVTARSSLIVVIAISVLLGASAAALLGRATRRRRRPEG
jgi:uncharacterized integral membrane protein